MAGLTPLASEADCVFGIEAGPNSSNSEPEATGSAGASPSNPSLRLSELVYVRYLDHVLYNRAPALVMKPQKREAVGWKVYDCELYVILSWDRDADSPTLHGGDPKASGLVLLRSDILEFRRLNLCPLPLQNNLECHLNCKAAIEENELALKTKKRKTQTNKGKETNR